MENWENLYPDSDSLKRHLGLIRNAGQFTIRGNGEIRRADLVSPLLNSILGEEYEWTSDQCSLFFEKLLREYCEADKLGLLLAVSGYGDEYRKLSTAAKRRGRYFDLTVDNESSGVSDAPSLSKREESALRNIAERMQEDYKSGKLQQFVKSIFEELQRPEPFSSLEDSSSDLSQTTSATTSDASEDANPPQPPRSKKWLIPAFAGLAVLLAAILLITRGRKMDTPSATPTSENITYNLSYADGNDEGKHWGDSSGGRQAYTNSEVNSGALGDSIVFNSITDGEFGDERNFVGAALVSGQESVWYGDQIEVKDGETYVICLYLHNDNPDGLNAIAEGTRVLFSLPTTTSDSHTIIGYLDSSNAQPIRSWDAVTLHSNEAVYIAYVEGSARYYNSGMGSIPLTDDIITAGAAIGYDRFDGKIPGGHGYEGIVTIQVKVRTSVTTKLSTLARLKGTSQWSEAAFANIGDEVEFQIEYENLTEDTAENVMIRDILPDNLEYISGSTILYNASYQNGMALDNDTVTTTGINIGNYGARGNAYVRFSAKVVNENLANGANQLVNWASATVNGEVSSKDDASIMVNK